MADTTKISWCDATFNPWIGCTKVSAGCDNCYAEAQNSFRKWNGGVWGKGTPRKRTKTWGAPVKWNLEATKLGVRKKVFCASLADVFDNEVDPAWRADLFALIRKTPMLDWLLLTKRPHSIPDMLPDDWGDGYPNVWLGTTVESQQYADIRIPALMKVPAVVHFLSCEPLLGPLNLRKWLEPWTCSDCSFHGAEEDSGETFCADCDEKAVYDDTIGSQKCPKCGKDDGTSDDVGLSCPKCGSVRGWHRDCGFKFDSERNLINWVIVGGESGGKDKARPFNMEWARSLKAQCEVGGAAFFFKQTGSVITGSAVDHGYDPARWPEDLRAQQFPEVHP